MSIVTLVSGGLDSTLVSKLAHDEGLEQYPLFIDYGQRAMARELSACRRAMSELGLSQPKVAELSGFGGLIRSGLTDSNLHVFDDAFTPGRNLLFVLLASSYAYQVGADAISLGLLHEDASIFPDQTSEFVQKAEELICLCMGRSLKILTPLADFHKIDVVALAREKGIKNTYSCHLGDESPCGICIACQEFIFEEK